MTNDTELFPEGPMQLPGEPDRQDSAQKPPKTGGFSGKRIAIVVGLLLIVGGGFLAWKTFSKQSATTPTQNAAPQSSQNPQVTDTKNDVPPVTSTKTFKADFPRIEFTYPGNWVATASTEQEGVRIESPEFSYQSISGSAVTGNFRIYIRQGARAQDSKYIGRAVAALESEKLVYASPPPGQRSETNLSFFGLDTPDNFAFFMIAGNFSLEKGQSLGPDYGKEPETYIITGGYSTNELTDDLATNPVPLDYFQQTNAYKQAIDILKSLKLL